MKLENQEIIPTHSGTTSMPISTQKKLSILSYDYFDKLDFRSVSDLVKDESKKKNIRIRHVLDNHHDPNTLLTNIFAKMMAQVRTMVGTKNFIDKDGLRFFIEYVIDEYDHLTVGDFQVYCRNIITGEYGKAYENVSVQKLIMWLKEYESRRAEIIYQIKRSQDRKDNKVHDGTIDRKGLLRMADKFREMNERRKQRIADAYEGRYADIWDYIERNDLDEQEFVESFINRHARILKAKGYDPDQMESILFEKMMVNEMALFVDDENAKIRRKINKAAV